MVAGSTPPAVVIAAPASGSGKTTVATGLIGALSAAGHRVAPFKVGPDYIDPGYHGLAAGRAGRNLDPNLVGEHRVAPLFAAGAAGADIAVVEGVMGLFDGRIADQAAGDGAIGAGGAFGSTAQVAGLLGAPVILVVDAAGHSQSLAALLHGFLGFDTSVRIAGVILNRVGSPRHEQVLRQACARVGLAVLGVLRRDPGLAVPSRHLGLIPAAERNTDAVRSVSEISAKVGAALDLPAIIEVARSSRGPVVTPWSAADEIAAVEENAAGERPGSVAAPLIAVAGGAAFTFSYAEHAELLTAAGARVEVFDPLADPLPRGAHALVIGGGFPEEHGEQLSGNAPLLSDLRAMAAAGRPIHAECAGLLYLLAALDDRPMAGVLAGSGAFSSRLTLGYRDAVALTDSPLFPAGSRVTGHEFHRTRVQWTDRPAPAWGWRDADGRAHTEGTVHRGVHASYLHVHPAGYPEAVARFVRAARGPEAR